MNVPRLILAAPMSGSGKTTITAALVAAFTARGLRIAPFKVGPDYIDPTYHALAAGRACRNLDAWMLPPDRVRATFVHGTADADLALVEGVMGLFDGFSGRDDAGSTAQIARLVDAPVLLVLDASAMARSAAAIVQGVRDFDPRVRVAGVMINRVGSATHAQMVQDAIQESTGIPVVGYLSRDDALNLPERHLGLIPTHEPGRWRTWLDAARAKIAATVNLDLVLDLARGAPPLPVVNDDPFAVCDSTHRAVVAVARDAAFNFLYEDNLDLLRAAGAEIAFFSPLRDHALPRGTQAIYLCGGFPEVYAAELAANEALRTESRSAHHAGVPIYAECGGLMYLTEEIVDAQNAAHRMVGLLPGRSALTGRLTLGYRMVRALRDNWLWRAGETTRGHEFHYSVWDNRPPGTLPAYEILPSEFQPETRADGAQRDHLFASYVHLHFLARPELAARLVLAGHHTLPWKGME
jgi:cobyrinic acid a,c-diamide synthase